MPDTRQKQSNTIPNSSNGHIDNVEEGIGRMKMENGNANCDEKGGRYPNRPGELDCVYFLRTGLCAYGSKCRFNHPSESDVAKSATQSNGELPLPLPLPQRAGQPDCGFYLKTGGCKFGWACKFHHPIDRKIGEQPALNSLGLPVRQGAKWCPFYMRTYSCKFGAGCKFNHPQPCSTETGIATPGASAYGAVGLLPYANGVSTWFIPSYSPIIIPSSQSQGWSAYLGTLPHAALYGTSVYNTRIQQELVMSNLPERPDQPKCRYFMTKGSCEYGTDCKYHHPKERIAQLSMYRIGPHGLPIRTGEAVCSHFHMFGVCKYGLTCKFDHPLTGLNVQQTPNKSFSTESCPAKSSKISDWIQKPEAVNDDDNGHSGVKESNDQLPDDNE